MAYGLILPQAVLDIPRRGCINIHASLLPRWRGAAPVQRALLAGDVETGITIMQMDAGLDTGPMLLAQAIEIAEADTAATLTARLADLGADLLVRALRSVATLSATPQPAEGATYAAKIDKAEAWLDWKAPAVRLARQVRAFDPFPVAQARRGDIAIKLWRAVPLAGPAGEPIAARAATAPGTIRRRRCVWARCLMLGPLVILASMDIPVVITKAKYAREGG